jgi:hypothetical protein
VKYLLLRAFIPYSQLNCFCLDFCSNNEISLCYIFISDRISENPLYCLINHLIHISFVLNLFVSNSLLVCLFLLLLFLFHFSSLVFSLIFNTSNSSCLPFRKTNILLTRTTRISSQISYLDGFESGPIDKTTRKGVNKGDTIRIVKENGYRYVQLVISIDRAIYNLRIHVDKLASCLTSGNKSQFPELFRSSFCQGSKTRRMYYLRESIDRTFKFPHKVLCKAVLLDKSDPNKVRTIILAKDLRVRALLKIINAGILYEMDGILFSHGRELLMTVNAYLTRVNELLGKGGTLVFIDVANAFPSTSIPKLLQEIEKFPPLLSHPSMKETRDLLRAIWTNQENILTSVNYTNIDWSKKQITRASTLSSLKDTLRSKVCQGLPYASTQFCLMILMKLWKHNQECWAYVDDICCRDTIVEDVRQKLLAIGLSIEDSKTQVLPMKTCSGTVKILGITVTCVNGYYTISMPRDWKDLEIRQNVKLLAKILNTHATTKA